MYNPRFLTKKDAEKFSKLLENYQPSNQTVEIFRKSNFGVIAGPSGAGKDTIRNKLVDKYPEKYLKILSTTTRPMRPHEKEGIDYRFRDPEFIQNNLDSKIFLQAELIHNQQVSVVNVNEFKDLSSNQVGLAIWVVQAERKLKKIKQDIKTAFLIPPSLDELKRRILAERQLEKDELDRRVNSYKAELNTALSTEDYYCLINDDIEKVVELSHKYFFKNIFNEKENNKARNTIKQILDTI